MPSAQFEKALDQAEISDAEEDKEEDELSMDEEEEEMEEEDEEESEDEREFVEDDEDESEGDVEDLDFAVRKSASACDLLPFPPAPPFSWTILGGCIRHFCLMRPFSFVFAISLFFLWSLFLLVLFSITFVLRFGLAGFFNLLLPCV